RAMPLTLGLTGMDPATETALKATFLEANARLGEQWTLVSDAEAGHVVVDMDSMYGPMSWLRLHAAGKQVIGLTSAPRTQTDYRLGRPFDPAQMAELLAEIAGAQGVDLKAAAAGAPAGAAAPPPGAPARRGGAGGSGRSDPCRRCAGRSARARCAGRARGGRQRPRRRRRHLGRLARARRARRPRPLPQRRRPHALHRRRRRHLARADAAQ